MTETYDDPYAQDFDAPKTNVLGIVGFILAFCLSPLGLLISLVALTKPPRGFAIGGVVVGLIGSVFWVLGGLGFAAIWPGMKAGIELATDYEALNTSVESYVNTNGGPPADLSLITVDASALTDPWGNAWTIEVNPDDQSYTFRSYGFDGLPNTDDDVVLGPGMSDNELGEAIGEAIEKHYEGEFGG